MGVDGSPLVRSWFASRSPATEVPLLNATSKSFCVLAQLVEMKLQFDGHAPTYRILHIQHLKHPWVMSPALVRSNLSPALVTDISAISVVFEPTFGHARPV